MYICKICGKEFESSQAYAGHMKNHVDKSNWFKCDICGKKISSEIKLEEHISRIHSKVYICEICGKEFKTSQAYAGHMQKHTDKSNWIKCDICGRLVPDEIKLEEHKERAHSKKYVCKYCGKEFDTVQSMNGHITTVHSENSINNTKIECKYCDKTFINCGAYKRHLIKHIDPERNEELAEKIRFGIKNIRKYSLDKKIICARSAIKAAARRLRNGIAKSEIPIINLKIDNLIHTGLGDYFVLFKNNRLKNPDFIVKDFNKAIEVISGAEIIFKANGDTNHYLNELKNRYNEVNYSVLFIMEEELNDMITIKEKIYKFIGE